MHLGKLAIFSIILLTLSGCIRNIDYEKIPLYDEVFQEPDEKMAQPRRSPPNNPKFLPDSYRRPDVNSGPIRPGANAASNMPPDLAALEKPQPILPQNTDSKHTAKPDFPHLSDVPPSPTFSDMKQEMNLEKQALEQQLTDAEKIQTEIYNYTGDTVSSEPPLSELAPAANGTTATFETQAAVALDDKKSGFMADLEVTEPKQAELAPLPKHIPPSMDPEIRALVAKHMDQKRIPETKSGGEPTPIVAFENPDVLQEAKQKATHEFGVVENPGQVASAATIEHEIDTSEVKKLPPILLDPFSYDDAPIINPPAQPEVKETVELKHKRHRDPGVRFLPESRYKHRYIGGPTHDKSYYGYTYFPN